jgi:hypothetical protein
MDCSFEMLLTMDQRAAAAMVPRQSIFFDMDRAAGFYPFT